MAESSAAVMRSARAKARALTRHRSRASALAGALLSIVILRAPALAGALLAFAAAQAPTLQPRFATKAELVLVDVSVLDRDGRPVADLKAQDFDLIVNGTPRPVHTAQFISTETTRASAASAKTTPTSGASINPA